MIPLYLDEDSVRHALVRGLRSNGIDVVTTLELGRIGAEDEDQLRFAVSQGRTLYTANLGDFHRLHTEWLRAGRHHAGIIVLPEQRTPVGGQIRALTKLVNAHSPETMEDQLEFLSRWL